LRNGKGASVWGALLLNAITPETLLGEGQVYGGGLYKMGSKELANVPADAIAALLPSVRRSAGQTGRHVPG